MVGACDSINNGAADAMRGNVRRGGRRKRDRMHEKPSLSSGRCFDQRPMQTNDIGKEVLKQP